MHQRKFAERFLEHLDKIDPAEVESFLLRTVKERDFTARIFETLTEGVVVFDDDANISLVNSAARRILRWSARARLLGENLLELLAPGPLRDEVETFLRDPIPVRDLEIVLRPGSRKVYNAHLLPIAEPDSGAALILQDLTPARDRQERDAQERKIASLAALTAGVAHDIKNPLNSLSIHAQLIERSVGDLLENGVGQTASTRSIEHLGQSCAAIGEEVERLRKCVDDFIDAARPRKPSLQTNDLNRLVQTVARMTRMEFEPLGIRVETLLDPETPTVRFDEQQLQCALRNLLRNAAEAIESARRPSGERLIVLRTVVLEKHALLEVVDNGCGIAKEDRSKVFEPYFTTKFNGSGLGLMAVGRIVREHGGNITMNSTEGEGTTLTLEFPLARRSVKLLESNRVADEA